MPPRRTGQRSSRPAPRPPAPETSIERREERKLSAELKHHLIENIFSTIGVLGRAAAIVLCFYCMYLSAAALAGKQTSVTSIFKAVVEAKDY